ncbi:MAG: glycoside hydrolase family 3 N-terminal domain-containing protein [Shimia sp.]
MSHAAAIFGCGGTTLTDAERAFFGEVRPWGFILFDRNINDAAQTVALTQELRAAVGWHAPILVDQEGGRVQRLWPPLATHFQAAEDDLACEDPERAFWLRGRLIAEDLRAVGIDANCAPLADIARPETTDRLRNRCYGADAASVARHARAMTDGMAHGGVLPVLKHIPGHGRARVDSHLELPRVTADRATLDTDFEAFRALADLPLGMTCHLKFDAIDPDAPATQSPAVIDVIRREIGFDGLLMTDDLEMEALSGSMADRARRSLDAGVDVILHCNGDLAQMREVAGEAATMTPDAQRRADAAIAARPTPTDIDIDALRAERRALFGGRDV